MNKRPNKSNDSNGSGSRDRKNQAAKKNCADAQFSPSAEQAGLGNTNGSGKRPKLHNNDQTRKEEIVMPEKMKTEQKSRASVTELFEEAMSKPVSELYEQAMTNYEQALRTGIRIQEESGKWLTTMLDQATSPQDWQKWVKAMSDRLIPETQKHMEENIRLVEQNSRTGVELMKKAFEAAQCTSVLEGQAKMLNFWGASLNAFRDNAQAATQANTKAIEMWVEFLRKNAEMAGAMNGGKAKP